MKIKPDGVRDLIKRHNDDKSPAPYRERMEIVGMYASYFWLEYVTEVERLKALLDTAYATDPFIFDNKKSW